MGTPHPGREAEMRAVAARLVVPPVRPVRAVAKVPAPSRPRELVKGEELDARVLAAADHLMEDPILPVDPKILAEERARRAWQAGQRRAPTTGARAGGGGQGAWPDGLWHTLMGDAWEVHGRCMGGAWGVMWRTSMGEH